MYFKGRMKIYDSLKKLNQKVNRSGRPEVFCEKAVLRHFAKFTGKHLCQSLFSIKLEASDLQLH